MLPQEKFLNLDPLRFLLTQSGTRLFNTCDKTILTILNFKRFLGGRGNSRAQPPPPPGHNWATRVLLIKEVVKCSMQSVLKMTSVRVQ